MSTYWPEFAQQGKERVTVRQLLAHQAGLYTLDEPLDRLLVADLEVDPDFAVRQREFVRITRLSGDPGDVALREALNSALTPASAGPGQRVA